MLVPYNCATTEDSSPVAVGYFEAVENNFERRGCTGGG